MVESIFVGIFLAALYSFFVQRWTVRSGKAASSASQGRILATALMRLSTISVLFFLLSKVAVLDIAVVMLAFIVGVSFSLFFLARKMIPARVKAGDTLLKGGKNGW